MRTDSNSISTAQMTESTRLYAASARGTAIASSRTAPTANTAKPTHKMIGRSFFQLIFPPVLTASIFTSLRFHADPVCGANLHTVYSYYIISAPGLQGGFAFFSDEMRFIFASASLRPAGHTVQPAKAWSRPESGTSPGAKPHVRKRTDRSQSTSGFRS